MGRQALVGYARVSSVGQSLEVQLDKLKHCDKIFQDKKSGASGERPEPASLPGLPPGRRHTRVTRLDRLARSTWHLCQIADDLGRQHVGLQVLEQHIDTGHATGRLLFHMLGAIAQFETEIRAERQMEGIQKAKARGVRFGRKKTLTPAQVAELRAAARARGSHYNPDAGRRPRKSEHLLEFGDRRRRPGRDTPPGDPGGRRRHHGQEKSPLPGAHEAETRRSEGYPCMAVSSACRRGGEYSAVAVLQSPESLRVSVGTGNPMRVRLPHAMGPWSYVLYLEPQRGEWCRGG